MNPRTASIIALSLAVIAAFIALFNYLKDDPPTAMNAGIETGQPRNSDRERAFNFTESKSKEERLTRAAREELVREVKQKQLTFWSQNASANMVSAGLNYEMPAAMTPVPKIEIDTNISVSTLFGGFVKSNMPYDIRAYYMDGTFTFDSAEFTTVTVTYVDGTVDPGVAALKLPLRLQHTIHESYNSMGEEGIVVTKSRIIDAAL